MADDWRASSALRLSKPRSGSSVGLRESLIRGSGGDYPRVSAADPKHHVVIVGCGFGGLFAARALKRAPVRVTIVDRTNHHLFQPLLYQVATGILSEGQIAPAIRDVLGRLCNLRVVLAAVREIDVTTRRVHAEEFGR